MQVLVVKRPVHARREDFFLYAEAFAGMVHLEYISLDGVLCPRELLFSVSMGLVLFFVQVYATAQLSLLMLIFCYNCIIIHCVSQVLLQL